MSVRLADLAATHTTLDPPAVDHLKRLVATWNLVADFCFSDLLLMAQVAGAQENRFVVLDQVRPTTGQTLYRHDMVGVIYDEVERPLVARAFRLGEIVEGSARALEGTERTWRFCIPVRFKDQLIAVVTRESPTTASRRLGELERVYLEIFERLARMIAEGSFPFAEEAPVEGETPRVGDGVIFLDAGGRVRFASPNAVTVLHRLGIHANAQGALLREVGFDDSAAEAAYALRRPVLEEAERGDTSIIVYALPLLGAGEPEAAVLLLRDVTELRRRDRMLLSKDATIREIHHRVKNNLQTIASLLRLQARRLSSEEAKAAVEESVRRIRSIALVHETLSRDVAETVDFGEICAPLVEMIRDAMAGDEREVTFSVEGDPGQLPAEIATPLAVVLNELLQNAAEHAFPDGRHHHVWVRMERRGDEVVLEVRDDGVGLPPGFSLEASGGLGLSIVHSLVTSELGGSIRLDGDGGTRVHIVVPVPRREGREDRL